MEIAAQSPQVWQPPVARAGAGERLVALGVAAASGTILGVGAWLAPDPSGVNTHTGLGLPPCGWLASTGHPCPTCGMTTAVSAAGHGRFVEAVKAQPAGFLMAVVAAAALWIGVYTAVTGSGLGRLVGTKAVKPRALWAALAVLLASWAYKWSVCHPFSPPAQAATAHKGSQSHAE